MAALVKKLRAGVQDANDTIRKLGQMTNYSMNELKKKPVEHTVNELDKLQEQSVSGAQSKIKSSIQSAFRKSLDRYKRTTTLAPGADKHIKRKTGKFGGKDVQAIEERGNDEESSFKGDDEFTSGEEGINNTKVGTEYEVNSQIENTGTDNTIIETFPMNTEINTEREAWNSA